MKSLSKRQIKGAKYPNQLGRNGNPSDNYNQIFCRLKDSIMLVEIVLKEILPYSVEYSERYESARKIEEQFTIRNLSSIFQGLFPLEVDTHGNKTKFFNSKFFNSDRIELATHLLQFSSEYLLQALPKSRSAYLHSRIDSLVQELDVMIDDLSNTRNLEKQIAECREHIRGAEPEPLYRGNLVDIECLGCRHLGHGKTAKDAIEKISHTQQCPYLKDDLDEMLKLHKWFRGPLEI